MKEKTIFEKIVSKEIPCHKIYEDKETFAFLDINPNTKGHTLVIPKLPFKNIYELPPDLNKKLFKTVQKISIAIKKSLKADGINIVMNNEASAGQIIFHAHVHVIPRYGEISKTKNRHIKYLPNEAQEIAEKIKENII